VMSPKDQTLLAVSSCYERKHWTALEPMTKACLRNMNELVDGEIARLACSASRQQWGVAVSHDLSPLRHGLYQHQTKSICWFGSPARELAGLPLVQTRTNVVAARDGTPLVCHWTVPNDGAKGWPLVVLARATPWGRDRWGFNPHHQWLASRGYAVLSVNARGAARLGRSFMKAAEGQWSQGVVSDYVDAVRWLCAAGVADPRRVAMVGGRFGGYVALSALAFASSDFTCAVSVSPLGDMRELYDRLEGPAVRDYDRRFLRRCFGASNTPFDSDAMARQSPFASAQRITRPLMMLRRSDADANDLARSGELVGRLQANDVPVMFALFGNDKQGAGQARYKRAQLALVEAFLARQLGGEAEPIGYDFQKVNFHLVTGATLVGLPAGYHGTV